MKGVLICIRSRGDQAYLAVCGIRLPSTALRFHPGTPIGRGCAVRFRPALIAAVEQDGIIFAIQRCFLEATLPALAADLAKPRLMLGQPGLGAVRLQPPGSCTGLAEGVETAISAAILLGIPVWAALGNERLPRIAIPPAVEQLVLLPDNDRAGRLADRLARQAHVRPGLTIETIWHGSDCNDWNDVLRGGEKGGVPVRFAA